MEIEFSGRNFEITDKVRSLVEKRLSRVAKYFTDIIEVRCVLDVQKHRNICEIYVVGKDYDVKSIQQADTMEDAINSTVDHLKRQAKKNREKITDRRRGKSAANVEVESWEVQVLEPGKIRSKPKEAPRIIKTNTLPIRPMSIEEAAIKLGESRNEFIVFRDLDTDRVTVIYRRRDENFGMITPEF